MLVDQEKKGEELQSEEKGKENNIVNQEIQSKEEELPYPK